MTGPTAQPADACLICGSQSVAPLFEKGGRWFSRCVACAFQFSRGPGNPNLEQAIDGYEPAYRQYLDSSPVDAVNHEATVRWIEQFVALDHRDVSLLDVGAGSGKLIRYLRSTRSCHSTGLEPSDALFRGFDLGSLGVQPLSLPEFRESGAHQFNVVTSFDVIEHVSDPVEFVSNLCLVTKPGGYVFLSTPDAGSLVARMLGRRWHHYNRYHLSLFDPRSIVRVAREAGFAVVGVEHRGKRFPLTYLRRYLRDFVLPRPSDGQPQPNHRGLSVSLNLFDIMSVVLRKST